MIRKLAGAAVGVGLAVTAVAAPAGAAGHEPTVLKTNLSWQQEVDTGSTSGFGFASVRLEEDRVCFGLRWTNTGKPVAAHIHQGAAGSNGPVAVGLFMGEPGPNAVRGAAWGCVGADDEVIDAIAANPSGYYVNVHTASVPAGHIRGQLG